MRAGRLPKFSQMQRGISVILSYVNISVQSLQRCDLALIGMIFTPKLDRNYPRFSGPTQTAFDFGEDDEGKGL